MDEKLKKELQDWMETPADKRDVKTGARLCRQITHNVILGNNYEKFPKRFASHVEYQLSKFYKVRVKDNSDHELSMAGSSWQRAYTIATTNPAITDGSAYSYQYITESDYLTKLSQAYAGGTYDGCYFILKSDLTIDLSTFADIVFTGHLDALDHTITLTNTNATDTRKYLFKGLGTGWNSEVLNTKIVGGTLFNADAEITGHVSNCWNDGTRIADVTPNLSDVK